MFRPVELFRDRGDCYEWSPRPGDALDRTDVESPVKHRASRIVHSEGAAAQMEKNTIATPPERRERLSYFRLPPLSASLW